MKTQELIEFLVSELMGRMNILSLNDWEPELTSDGFVLVSHSCSYRMGMREYMGTIFVNGRDDSVSYSMQAFNQAHAKALYQKTIDFLLAA